MVQSVLRSRFALLALVAATAHAQPVPGAGQGVLIIERDPVDAVVSVDGVVRSRPPAELPVAAGERLVRVSLAGYAPFEASVRVPAGGAARVTARLVRLMGVVSVGALPPGATATVDGEPLGDARATPTGLATVVVTVPDGPALRSVVTVAAGAETQVRYDPSAFRPARALLAVMAPGALHIRDGRTVVGASFTAVVVGGLATALAASVAADRADSGIELALERYDAADNEPDAVAAREEVERLTSAVRTSRQVRGASLAAAGLAYAVSVVDSFARHVRRPALVTAAPRSSPVSVRLSGGGAGLSVRF